MNELKYIESFSKEEIVEKMQHHLNEVEAEIENPRSDADDEFVGSIKKEVWLVAIQLAKQIDESQITDEQAWNKIAEAYPETAQSLRITLDHAVYGQEAEPQKVKVPACVDKYLNFCMKIELSLTEALKREIPSGVYGPYPDDFKFIHETLEWLESPINQDIFADAWLHGWKVEEEPKYYVDLGHDTILYQADDVFWIEARENNEGCFKQQFTESEIKAIDERYWPFAVPVEKV